MIASDKDPTKTQGEALCKSCGLCCYAFHNLGLIADEEERNIVEAFGGKLFTNASGALSFSQPCPAYRGLCTVHPGHPASCQSYQCKLLKRVLQGGIPPEEALEVVTKLKVEVALIDSALKKTMGERIEIVDDYIANFMSQADDDKRMGNPELLLHFGVYKHMRKRYFDLSD